ncbi:MAG: acyl carrier protein [Magnetospirillum sp.]
MTDCKEIVEHIVAHLRTVIPPGTEISTESRIVADLGLDSLAVMNFVMALEDEFDVSLTMDNLAQVETIADLAGTLAALINRVAE